MKSAEMGLEAVGYVSMAKAKDLTGQKFGLLTVKKFAGIHPKFDYAIWECECECGKIKNIRGYNLTKGLTISCGCYASKQSSNRMKKNMTTHGMSRTRIYHIHQNILNICYKKKSFNYKFYGAKGITVCDEWRNDFLSFYEWSMKHGYTENKCLYRIDKKGNYEPSNCIWAEEVMR